jgi:hypothetical protein
MLSRLTRTFRIKAAIALAAVYAFCVLSPAAALAFVDGPTAVHCLADQHGIAAPHHQDAAMHVHADGTTHQHANGTAQDIRIATANRIRPAVAACSAWLRLPPSQL